MVAVPCLCLLLCSGALPASSPAGKKADLRLSVMIGFIKDPQHQSYTIEEWAKNIGKDFDARSLVARVKQAGATEIIWYDKWIDGLVFRKTKTTSYQTERDFLAELRPECRRQGIRLVTYFNTFADGNPEFALWACTDQRGKPVPWSGMWPCNQPSRFSPFRDKALAQVRELVADYKVDGLWLDVPGQPPLCFDRWTREAFQKRMGKFPDEATPSERTRFSIDASVEWNQEVAAYARGLNPAVTITTNGFYDATTAGPRHTVGKAAPVDYMSAEVHQAERQQTDVPVMAQYEIPSEGGILLSSSWFTPIQGGPPKCVRSPRQVQQEMATLFGDGIHVYLAVTLDHSGKVDEPTMQMVELGGNWLKARRAYLDGAARFADVALVLGSGDAEAYYWPGAREANYGRILYDLESKLRDAGYLTRRLLNVQKLQSWGEIPKGIRTVIVPDRVSLTSSDAAKVRQFVEDGGKVIAFARGHGLSVSGDKSKPDAIFGVESAGSFESPGQSSAEVSWKDKSLRLRQMGYLVPKTAEPLLWAVLGREGSMPAITVNRASRGLAYCSAAPESGFEQAPELLEYLWQQGIGDPVWKAEDGRGRYIVRVLEKDGRRLLHIIKKGGSEGDRYTRFDINGEVVPFTKATVVPDGYALKVTANGKWKSLELLPSPEVMISLE